MLHVSAAVLLAVTALGGGGAPAASGVWGGEWKVSIIEADSGAKLGGRLTLDQRGEKVCARWSWNRFADGRRGRGTGKLSRRGLSLRGADRFGSTTWSARMTPEADTFFGPYRAVERGSGDVVVATIRGVRLGPPRAALTC